jgi:hypothetical protein
MFQIKGSKMYSLVGILIVLRCYHLQVENFD